MAWTSARVWVIEEPTPFGDVPLAPSAATGRSEAELAHAMAERLLAAAPGSDAEALRVLRGAFPHAPLTVRLAALAALMRRGPARRDFLYLPLEGGG
jgi:hypothetical protein